MPIKPIDLRKLEEKELETLVACVRDKVDQG